jgi:K+-sensing histidine kinase KdpD
MTEKIHVDDGQLRKLMHLMSHDLRNPLAAIVTNLEFAKRLLARAEIDPDLAESVEDSVTACDVLRRIVANLDVIVKGEDVNVTIQEAEVGKIIKEVARRCQDRASQARLEINLDGTSSVGRTMLDKNLFSLVVENLIANSIQHAPRRSTIEVGLEESPTRFVLTVSDAGPAIPEALREVALGPEGHTPGGRTEGSRYGRGLGLLAANAAAAASGCELAVGGTETNVFTVTIPRVAE